MDRSQLIQAVDEEIENLERARALLTGGVEVTINGPRRKRVLSPEARQRIVDAQKRRWDKVKRARRG